MAYTHDVHGTVDGTTAGFLSGMTLAIAAIALVVVVGVAVLLLARPWDNGGGNGITNNNSVPVENQPAPDGDTGGGVSQPDGQ